MLAKINDILLAVAFLYIMIYQPLMQKYGRNFIYIMYVKLLKLNVFSVQNLYSNDIVLLKEWLSENKIRHYFSTTKECDHFIVIYNTRKSVLFALTYGDKCPQIKLKW